MSVPFPLKKHRLVHQYLPRYCRLHPFLMSKQNDKKKTSIFNNILDAAKQSENEDSKLLEEVAKTPEKPASAKKGRPRGKRSNPDFEQVTAYVRSKTYRDVKIALLQQSRVDYFSELIEHLLNEWLSTQKGE